jgi:cyclic pyranopterin phosphate synthase
MALDRFGRSISYLRISLTDHCNLRCIYCMTDDVTFQPGAELMQDREILLLVEVFTRLGFDKIRLTGGEPTVRAHIVDLVRGIAQIPGIKSLSMTTNGILLPRLALQLAEAGLQRVNISLDTLDAEKFQRLTRCGNLVDVWKGIRAAEQAGLVPLKFNTVVVRGYNETDVVDLANLTLDHPWQVRFIELMPFGGATVLQTEQLVSTLEIKKRIESAFGLLKPINNGNLEGEARLYQLQHGLGLIGFISSVTQPFCAVCNRTRLTADGRLRLCLLREGEVDLLKPLRNGATPEDLRQIIVEGIWQKPWGHGLAEGLIPLNRAMNQIGG